MTVNLFAVHQVLYATLTANNAVAGGRVYEHVPQDVTFPHLEIAEALDAADDASGTGDGSVPSYGIEHVVTLHAWSRYRGHKELYEIAGQVRAVLHQKHLDVPGLSSCLTWVESALYQDEADGLTRRATIRVRMECRT